MTTAAEISRVIYPQAFGRIAPYVVRAYELDPEGAALVIRSNEVLPDEYFDHLTFPVSDYWGKYFKGKLSALRPRGRDVMLDVCCGTGTLCLNVMPGIGFERCIAIDNSEAAIAVLRRRMRRDQRIDVMKQDITRLSMDCDSVDAVYGNSFLHHLPDNYAFLAETLRILKPGGVMVLTGEPTVAAPALENAIIGNILAFLRLIGVRRRRRVDREMPITDIWLYEEDAVREMLAGVGFVDIRLDGFGVLAPLLNWPSALVFRALTGRSLQPEWYWKWLGRLDDALFGWLPADRKSHVVIAARKPGP
jgi:ubiquinone/menaquinone biosynthesis C-methylase UbiE